MSERDTHTTAMHIALAFAISSLSLARSFDNEFNKEIPEDSTINKEPTFKDYLKKFNPLNVWKQLELTKKKTNRTDIRQEDVDHVVNKIDSFDELLSLRIDDMEVKEPELLDKNSRRYWKPPGGFPTFKINDPYWLRPRLYNLMKQAIYQVRDKLINMQKYRDTLRNDALYRMGFLTSKTDKTAKLLSQVAYRAWRHCELLRRVGTNKAWRNIPMYEMIEAEERVLNLWLELELLVDLITQNDKKCKRLLRNFQNIKPSEKRDWFID